MYVTNNILNRVFCFRYHHSQGTCFTIEVEGKQYLVTAQHIVKGISEADTIQILHNSEWKNLSVQLVGHGQCDVTVLAPATQLSAKHRIEIDAGFYLGQELRFLGFPYGLGIDMGDVNRNFPVPLVKQGLLSGSAPGKFGEIWIDGYNNPGFSGGPVICQSTEHSNTLRIIGVISGYRNEAKILYLEDKVTPFQYFDNTGIVIASPISQATDIIEQNPIGVETS